MGTLRDRVRARVIGVVESPPKGTSPSQNARAKAAGIDPARYSKIKNDGAGVDLDVLERIAERAGLLVDYFIVEGAPSRAAFQRGRATSSRVEEFIAKRGLPTDEAAHLQSIDVARHADALGIEVTDMLLDEMIASHRRRRHIAQLDPSSSPGLVRLSDRR